MKKCESCGKLVQDYLQECPACGGALPDYGSQPVGATRSGPAAVGAVPPPAPDAYVEQVAMGEYAGFWIRFGAYFLDGLIILGAQLPFLIVGFMMQAGAAADGQQPSAMVVVVEIIRFAVALAAWFANNVYLQGTRGASLGKRVCKIIVLDAEWQVLGIGRNLLREIFKGFISTCACLLWLGAFWMIWDDNAQTWHDKVAGSYVYYD